jgi:hypothetical protein
MLTPYQYSIDPLFTDKRGCVFLHNLYACRCCTQGWADLLTSDQELVEWQPKDCTVRNQGNKQQREGESHRGRAIGSMLGRCRGFRRAGGEVWALLWNMGAVKQSLMYDSRLSIRLASSEQCINSDSRAKEKRVACCDPFRSGYGAAMPSKSHSARAGGKAKRSVERV